MAEPAIQQPLRFLKSREVCEKIGRGRTSLDKLVKEDESFLKPTKDGEGRSCVNSGTSMRWTNGCNSGMKRRPEPDA